MINANVLRSLITIIMVLVLMGFSVDHAYAEPEGTLTIFHAGSLAIPFKEMSAAFEKKYPKVKVLRESAGSRTCARKISDLKRACDVMASADYTVIENLLIPEFADWNISFATNEMAIMFRPESKYASEINGENWYEILLRKGVEYGHSDPNSDPCGYRSQMVWQLAESYYHVNGLYQRLKENCPARNIRPKETDLIALLEVGQIDYAFIYRSVCKQHHAPFVILPDEINLKSEAHAVFYKRARIQVTGKKPGETITQVGKPMVYGLTIPKNAQNLEAAIRFVGFILSAEGREVMRQNGQPPVFPARGTGKIGAIPMDLKKWVVD